MNFRSLVVLASICFATSSAIAQEKWSSLDSVSYAMGINMGEAWKKQGISQLNPDLFVKAMMDVMKGKDYAFTKEESDKVFGAYAKLVKEKQSELVKVEGKAYREKNAKNPAVVTLPSGLQYEVLAKGTGTIKPIATDKVKVHYHGTLIDGTVFDSSVKRGNPLTIGLNQVIKGWTEGVQLMNIGDKFKFTIPSELAYGDRPQGALISAGATLIFEVELLGIN